MITSKREYEELYDKLTVSECRDWVKHVLKNKLPDKIKTLPESEQLRFASVIIELPIYFKKGERYLRREETIAEWMRRDQEKDDFIDSNPAPTSYCPKCNKLMELIISELDHYSDEKLRMMFLYKCSCGEKKGLYGDGEPYVFKRDYCPKCNKEWDRKHTKSKDKITTTSACAKCGYKEKDVLDLNTEEEIDPNFDEDRVKFCMSEEEGETYRREKATIPDILKWQEEVDQREKDKKYYDKAKKLKTLTISELSDLLAEELIKFDFRGLTITNTEVTRDLIVSFSLQDTKKNRAEYDSRSALKKAIIDLVKDTNWKLMSDGVSYKLGLLTGRLRGIDQEKVLVDEMKDKTKEL